jgi:hypothetical protein
MWQNFPCIRCPFGKYFLHVKSVPNRHDLRQSVMAREQCDTKCVILILIGSGSCRSIFHILLHTTRAYTMDPSNYQRLVIQVSALAGIILLVYARESVLLYASRFDKVPQHMFILTGQDWINELIAGHDGRFYNELGMHKHVFWALLAILRRETGLGDTRHVSAEEQLAIFLHYAHRGLSNRALQERFQRSGDTISKWVVRF